MAATDADVAEESLPEANRTAGGSSTAATRYAHLLMFSCVVIFFFENGIAVISRLYNR